MPSLQKISLLITACFMALMLCAQTKPAAPKKPTTPVAKKPEPKPATNLKPEGILVANTAPDPYFDLIRQINTNVEPKLVWVNNAGGGGQDIATDILVTESGYLIVGETNSVNGDLQRTNNAWNVWLSTFDQRGNLKTGKLYGGSVDDRKPKGIFTNFKDSTITFFAQTASPEYNHRPNGPYKHPEADIWMIKISMKDFSIVFQKSLGTDKEELLHMVKRLKNGQYLLAATTTGSGGDLQQRRSTGENRDIWLVLLSADGEILQQNSFGGSDYDFVYDAISTSDNHYLMVGKSKSKDLDFTGAGSPDKETIFALKVDQNFKQVWIKNFSNTGYSIYNTAVTNANEGDGYLITCYPDITEFNQKTKGRNDFVATKINLQGDVVWKANYGGKSSDEAYGIINDIKKDGYIIYGTTTSNEGDVSNNHSNSTSSSYPNRYFADLWFVKTDNNGQLVWQKTVGGNSTDEIFQLKQFPNGAMVFAGSSESKSGQVKSNKGNADYYVGLISFTDSTIVEPNKAALPSCTETKNTMADYSDIVDCMFQKRAEEGLKLLKTSSFDNFDIYTTSNDIVIDVIIDNCGTLPIQPALTLSTGTETIKLTTRSSYTGNGIAIFSQMVTNYKRVKLTTLKAEGLPKNCYYTILVHEKN